MMITNKAMKYIVDDRNCDLMKSLVLVHQRWPHCSHCQASRVTAADGLEVSFSSHPITSPPVLPPPHFPLAHQLPFFAAATSSGLGPKLTLPVSSKSIVGEADFLTRYLLFRQSHTAVLHLNPEPNATCITR